ncbi:MAG: hypothetical protein ABIJ12_02925, partial [bacterium]
GFGDVDITYTSWKMTMGDEEATLHQLVFPVTGFIPLQDNLELHLFLANATHSAKVLGEEFQLNGLGDLKLQLSKSFSDDQLLASIGLNLPTGKKSLDVEGEQIIYLLSNNYLDLPSRGMGEGFGFNVLLGGAQAAGNLKYGGGILYEYKGSYEPYASSGDYNPGDKFSINAGGDLDADKTTFSADIIYSLFTNDKVGGDNKFKQSPQLELRTGVVYKLGNTDLNAGISYIKRGDNKIYADSSSQVILETLKLFGDELLLYGGAVYKMSETFSINPSLTYRSISANDESLATYQLDKSSVIGVGLAFNKTFQEKYGLKFGGKYFSGSADGSEIDLTGLQFTASLTANF